MNYLETDPQSAALYYLEKVLGVSWVMAPEGLSQPVAAETSSSPVAVYVSDRDRGEPEALQLLQKMAQAMGLKEFYLLEGLDELQDILRGQGSVPGLESVVLLSTAAPGLPGELVLGRWERRWALPLMPSHDLAELLGSAEDPDVKSRKRETWQHLQMVMAELKSLKERKN